MTQIATARARTSGAAIRGFSTQFDSSNGINAAAALF